MPGARSATPSDRSGSHDVLGAAEPRNWGAIGLITFGLVVLAVSFVSPLIDDGRSAWTPAKAEQLAEASRQLHQLSATPPTPSEGDQYERVSTDYKQLQAELKAAQGRPTRNAWALRAVAAALVAIGVVIARKG